MEDKDKDLEKNIDESWKDSAEKEKKSEDDFQIPEDMQASFPMFISSLGVQALMSLGEIENPMTKVKETDLAQAKYIIDTIEMLQAKTASNVTDEEKQMLEDILYQLRMVYMSKSQKQ